MSPSAPENGGYVCLSLCLYLSFSVSLSFSLSVSLSPSLCLPRFSPPPLLPVCVCVSLSLSLSPSLYSLSISPSPCLYLSVFLSLSVCLYVSVCLSLSLSYRATGTHPFRGCWSACTLCLFACQASYRGPFRSLLLSPFLHVCRLPSAIIASLLCGTFDNLFYE